MTKVAFVITKSEFGGAQEYLNILMSSMKQYERILISGETGFLTEKAKDMGVPVRICEGLVHPVRPIQDIKAIINMYRLLRQEMPALVHANSSKAGVVVRAAAFLARIPVVFTAHGWAFTEGVGSRKARLFSWIERVMAPAAQRIICVSNYDENLAIRHRVSKGPRLLTVHNGIPDIPDRVATHDNPVPRVIMAARFCAQKDYSTLLHAVSLLKDCRFTVQCVGDGVLLDESRQLADELGLKDRVEFLGARNDVADLLKSADIFALISNWEGFPISVLEGMRAGLPVVATRVGGIPESVSDQRTGLLVEPGSKTALADALRLLITRRDLRKKMGHAGRARYLLMFTAEHMIAKTCEVYDSVLINAKNSGGQVRQYHLE